MPPVKKVGLFAHGSAYDMPTYVFTKILQVGPEKCDIETFDKDRSVKPTHVVDLSKPFSLNKINSRFDNIITVNWIYFLTTPHMKSAKQTTVRTDYRETPRVFPLGPDGIELPSRLLNLPFLMNLASILKVGGVAHIEFDAYAMVHLGGYRLIPFARAFPESKGSSKFVTRVEAFGLPDEFDDAVERMYRVIAHATKGVFVKSTAYAKRDSAFPQDAWEPRGPRRLHLRKTRDFRDDD